MKKFFITLALTFLFFFLFLPNNTYAKEIDYTDDKYLIDLYPNFYSNLDNFYIDNLSSGFQFYWGARRSDGYYNFDRWSKELHTGDGGGILFNGYPSTFYADNNNISSFIYGFEFSFPKLEANKKYQFDLIVSTSKEIDYNEIRTLTDDISILYSLDSFGDWSSDKSIFNYLRFGFYREDNAESDAIHYHFLFQFSSNIDIYYLSLNYSTRDADVSSSSLFTFLDNKTNKNIAISVAQVRYFEVENFDFSSGEIHDGGGMTFDGERTDDSSFDNNYEVCDSLDFVCHFRNLKNWFLTIGRRISNGFEDIINFFGSFIDDLISAFTDILIPDSDYLSTQFQGLFKFIDEKLGFLTFPFEFIGNFLDRFLNIPNDPVKNITVPSISLGSFGTLIEGFSFNIAEYWEKPPFKQIYYVYLLFVHAFIVFGLYKLCNRKFEEMTGGSNK